MARIRTIKPEFFTSEDIVGLSPLARLLYIALWCEADREGRLAWKPKTFKMRYLPADNCDVDALCQELVDSGLVKLYGDGLAYIPQFRVHQHLNPREAASSYPDPDACSTRQPRVNDASSSREDASGTVETRDSDAQGGREGKGRNTPRVDDARSSSGPPDGFVAFWTAWPKSERKGGKAECVQVWEKSRLEIEAPAIVAHVKAMAATESWRKEGGRFVPAPVVYLRGRRWDGSDLTTGPAANDAGTPWAGAM